MKSKCCDLECPTLALDSDLNFCLSKPWKVEVIVDRSGQWCGNGYRFNTRHEAFVYAMNLFSRWTLVREWRVVQ